VGLGHGPLAGIAIGAVAFALSLGSGLGVATATATVTEFGGKGSGAGQFNEPSGVAVFQETGDVYLVDTNNARVESFGPEGAFRLVAGWGVSDGKSEFEICTADCRAGIEGSGAGQLTGARGIAVDNNPSSESYGDLYVVDAGNHRVQKFDAAGHFVLMFGKGVNAVTKGDVCTAAESGSCGAGLQGEAAGELGPGELFSPAGGIGVSLAGPGTVYVGDFARVEAFSADGSWASTFPVGEGFVFIPSLAVNASGEIYVVAGNLVGVHRYDAFGTELGTPFDTEGSPKVLTLGPSGEVYVDEHGDGESEQPHLAEFDPTGTELKSFDIGTEGGERGIAFGNAIARTYVLNNEAVRLVATPPVGPFTVPGSEALVDAKPSRATVTAAIDAEGSPTQYRFEYGQTTAYGAETAPTPLSEAGGLFAAEHAPAELTGLHPSTSYHFRTVAEDEHGHTTFGPDAEFATPPPVLITGESTTQVTPESARLNVDINPQGADTSYHFEYGFSIAYEQSLPVPEADAGAEEASASHSIVIEHLNPGTVYHYRVVAHNAFGPAQGPDRVFTTSTAAIGVALADGRVWEMVSPPAKNGAALEAISEEGGLIESSERGDALTYFGTAPIGAEAEPEGSQNIADSQFVARRRAPGAWATEDITTPHEAPVGFKPGKRAEYLFFSGDLSKGLVEPLLETPLSPEATERTPYVREPTGTYLPVVTASNVPPGTKFGGEQLPGSTSFHEGVEVTGAAPDLGAVALTSTLALTEDFTAPEENPLASVYRWSSDTRSLQLVSWLPASTATPHETPTVMAGDSALLGYRNSVTRHAVSRDGSRLVYEVEGPSGEHLFLRDVRLGKSVQLDLHEDGTAGVGAHVRFQDASADGRFVFFTDDERLTANATGEPNNNRADLYRCDVQELLAGHPCVKNVTVPLGAKEASDVLGNIVGTDESGDRVYFVANGRLTPDAVRGDCPYEASASVLPPASTSCNMFVYDGASGETRRVAVLSGRDFPAWGPQDQGTNLRWLSARDSPNGQYLAFMSQRSLTGYDNRDARSGAPDEEVFEYDFQRAQLTCVSCNLTGARPSGVFDAGAFPGLLVDRPKVWKQQWVAASIPGWTGIEKSGSNIGAPYQSRYLASDGRVFFNSSDGLVPGDVNGQFDVYEYEPPATPSCGPETGCVALMSSGRDAGETAFLDASGMGPGGQEGEDVFFLTAANLSPNDTDVANDVYDAHVCRAAADCPAPASGTPPPCTTSDACRAAPAPQPDIFGAPASSTFSGPGNLAPTPAVKVTARHLTRAQRLSKALRACNKKPKRKLAACKRQARRQFGPAHKAKTATAKANNRGTK
jgi:DNA-binding beta-propeller fold protein YncE